MGLFDKLKGFNETNTEAAKRLYDKATSEYKAKNYYSAVRLYEMAWDKDPDVGTFFNLSCCYYFEWGTSKDEKRCYELTRHAAIKDHPAAMNNLSFFLNTGYGCQEDRVEGWKGANGWKGPPTKTMSEHATRSHTICTQRPRTIRSCLTDATN